MILFNACKYSTKVRIVPILQMRKLKCREVK